MKIHQEADARRLEEIAKMLRNPEKRRICLEMAETIRELDFDELDRDTAFDDPSFYGIPPGSEFCMT